MTQLSVREAAGAGFRLIRREPLAVLGWAALYLVLAAAAAALLGATFGNFFVVLARPATPSRRSPTCSRCRCR